VLRAADLEAARPELASAVGEARQGIDRVASIVRDLKTFVRDDERQAGLVDLRRALDASIRIAENEIRHRARLVRQYEDQAVFVRANETRLVQVFLNVLVNATHAIQAGAAENNSIVVRLMTRDGQAEVTIQDTGSGMSSEVLARALDPFFTTKPVGVGTGLGLSVCSNVIRACGGELCLETELGRGTTVTIRLPHEQSAPAALELPEPAVSSAAQAGLRVLVIDDDPLVIRSLRRLLKPHDVTTVEHAPQALTLLGGESRFDLILCDLMMPELTGAELYQRVAAWGRGLEQQIVFITGGVFTEQMQGFLEQVPNRRLEKPIRANELDAILARVRAAERAS
jgi:CheY-like chemotaxis protein/two-component sensor histidine kinase